MKTRRTILFLAAILFTCTSLQRGQTLLSNEKVSSLSDPIVLRTLAYHQVTSTNYYGIDATPPIIDEMGECILFTYYSYDPRKTHVMLANSDGSGVKEVITMNDSYYDLQMDLSAGGIVVACTDEWNIYIAGKNTAGFNKAIRLNENCIKGLCVSGNGNIFFRINNNTSRADIPGTSVPKGIWSVGSDGRITQIVDAAKVAGTWGVTPDKVNFFASVNNRGGIDASSDGTKLIFVMLEPDAPGGEGQRLFSVNSDGTNIVSLTDRISWLQAFISPDGRKAAYLAKDKGYQYVGVVNTDGSDRKIVARFKEGDPSPFLNGFPDWGDRLTFNENGTKLLLGGTGVLCDVYSGDVIELAHKANTPEPVATDGMRFATMNKYGDRFAYMMGKYSKDEYPLAICDINPNNMKNLPALADIKFNPNYVLTNGRSCGTISAKVNTAMKIQNVGCTFLHEGLRDIWVCQDDRTPPQLVDDGSSDEGDLIAGDGIFMNSYVHACNEAKLGTKTVRVKVEAYSSDGRRHAIAMDCTPFTVSENPMVDVQDIEATPAHYLLSQNYPNPFNPATKICFQIPVVDALSSAEVHVTLKVYNVLGNEVAILVDENKLPGLYNIEFNASKLSSGLYFYRIQTGVYSCVRKMLLIK